MPLGRNRSPTSVHHRRRGAGSTPPAAPRAATKKRGNGRAPLSDDDAPASWPPCAPPPTVRAAPSFATPFSPRLTARRRAGVGRSRGPVLPAPAVLSRCDPHASALAERRWSDDATVLASLPPCPSPCRALPAFVLASKPVPSLGAEASRRHDAPWTTQLRLPVWPSARRAF